MKALIVVFAIFLGSVAFAQDAAPPHSAPAAKEPAVKAHLLTVSELDAALDKPGKVLVIDVRRPDEVSSNGGFPVYLSIQAAELEQNLGWIPKDRPIITVSNHAGRAGKAADLLSSKGFKVLGAVGSQTYEEAGGKRVVHIKIPAQPAAH